LPEIFIAGDPIFNIPATVLTQSIVSDLARLSGAKRRVANQKQISWLVFHVLTGTEIAVRAL
jgi:hypothetical protein